MESGNKSLVVFLSKHYALIIAVIIAFLFILLPNLNDVSFDALWYAAYIKAFPANFGEWNGGTANHFLHPRHLLYNPLSWIWWKFLSLFFYMYSYQAMQYLSSVFCGFCVYFLIKLVDKFVNADFYKTGKGTKNRLIPVFSAIFFAYSYVISWHSTTPEVYIIIALIFLLTFTYLWNLNNQEVNFKHVILLSLLGILSFLVHMQLLILVGFVGLFLFMSLKDLKKRLLYPIFYVLMIVLPICFIVYIIAISQWGVHSFAELWPNFHEVGVKVNFIKLVSPKGFMTSFGNMSEAIVGHSLLVGFIVFAINTYVFYLSVKTKNKFTFLTSLSFLVLFFLLRYYEERFTSGTWTKFWTPVITMAAINIGIFLKYINDLLSREDQYVFEFLISVTGIVLFIYNMALITLPRADNVRLNGQMGIAINMDKILTDKLDLYAQGGDDVYRHYLFTFSKVKRVYGFESYKDTFDSLPFYLITPDPNFCVGKTYTRCERFSKPVDRTDLFIYYLEHLK